MTRERELHLNLNILNAGIYGAAWRMPESDPKAFADVKHFIRCAQLAEKGKLDAVFLADKPGLVDQPAYRAFQSLEPTILLTAIAAATTNIGLIGTVSTSSNEPYNVARRFASLDHVSGGRSGWNVVTSFDVDAARNFGEDRPLGHAVRYDRASEFVDVVIKLWESWDHQAFIGDKITGQFIDPRKLKRLDHIGKYFSVAGPLNVPRSPQGRPVLVQAGASHDGRAFAAAYAELVFSLAQTQDAAIKFAADVRDRAKGFGRNPEAICIVPGLSTVIGGTEAEAQARRRELEELVPEGYALVQLAGTLGVDPGFLELDKRLPELAVPVDGNQTMFAATVELARREDLTVRQLLKRLGGGKGHRVVCGTPEQIANDIEEWFIAGAADGFNIMPDVLPHGAEVFVEEVIPVLQRRGLFRTEYRGMTLRDHLGLDRADASGL
ncbi:LLM class flavin-dependent oxidoreductase [Rhizobium rhizogenes]|uniref:LLM class flavin-dependent oxidoreductase n=1 Tax=Rhizobium rhizogenes TaxID=359 RepID=UPI0015742017|nr:LLM class flavin-dependent oxidoreductase [Rhizobium rhizogenes]NTI78656.1 LLM class flavin-dependent oxidoreductase [Rhizobium rhizogenes]